MPEEHEEYIKKKRFYQRIIIEDGLEVEFFGRESSLIRQSLFYAGCIVSCSVLYLFAHWFPYLLCVLTTKPSCFSEADWIFARNTWGQKALLRVKRSDLRDGEEKMSQSTNTSASCIGLLKQNILLGGLKAEEWMQMTFVEYHCIRFIYDERAGQFVDYKYD